MSSTAADIIRAQFSRESGRWYDRTGHLVLQVPSAKGDKQVTPDKRHAKKFGLLPSVGSVNRQAAKPGLQTWRDRQIIAAALSLPQGDTPDDIWHDPNARAALVLADAQQQVEQAAERGKDWHGVIESSLLGKWPAEGTVEFGTARYVKMWLGAEMGDGHTIVIERALVGDSYAGTPDIIAESADLSKTLLADIKTVNDDSPLLTGKDKPHEEWAWQLGAYWRASTADPEHCWEVIVGRTSGAVRLHHWTAAEINKGWQAFKCLLDLWCIRNDYNPATWTGKGE